MCVYFRKYKKACENLQKPKMGPGHHHTATGTIVALESTRATRSSVNSTPPTHVKRWIMNSACQGGFLGTNFVIRSYFPFKFIIIYILRNEKFKKTN